MRNDDALLLDAVQKAVQKISAEHNAQLVKALEKTTAAEKALEKMSAERDAQAGRIA